MKKSVYFVLWALLYFLFPLLLPRLSVKAEEGFFGYAYIPTNAVYFYSDKQGELQGLFRLPYSYYVRIVSEDREYYGVEYLTDGSHTKKLKGYCKKSEVIPVDYIPEMPYLYLNIEITYTLAGGGKDDGFSTITLTCAYYGDYTDGTKQYAYVLREDLFGYVERPVGLSYEKNTEYDERNAPKEQTPTTTTTKDSGLSAGQITLLILLCLLIPALAALIVRPTNKPPYDDP